MNPQEHFEKETGKLAHDWIHDDRRIPTLEYCEWLEQRNAEMVEALKLVFETQKNIMAMQQCFI